MSDRTLFLQKLEFKHVDKIFLHMIKNSLFYIAQFKFNMFETRRITNFHHK